MTQSNSIGTRIASIRRWQQLTLELVSEKAGITRSYLCKIENGQAVPSIAALNNIASALGVPASQLLDEKLQLGSELTSWNDALQRLGQSDKGYEFHAYMTHIAQKRMQPYLFKARRGDITHREALAHAGEEFVHVLEGQLEYRVGGKVYLLSKGDSLYFDSEHDHDVEPLSEEAIWLAVFVAPPAKRVYRRKRQAEASTVKSPVAKRRKTKLGK